MATKAAGGVLTAKQAPHRPGTAPALGLRAEVANVILSQHALTIEPAMTLFSFPPQVEQLDGRCLPSSIPVISISDVALSEGNSGQAAFVFSVSLSAASSKEVSVKYATANSSANTGDGDFIGQSGTLKFAPGETTKTVTVQVNGDAKVEPDERFFVNLSRARNAVIADAQGVGTILNDDSGGGGGGGGGGGCNVNVPCDPLPPPPDEGA